jgi:PAS domain S-box-containing protein
MSRSPALRYAAAVASVALAFALKLLLGSQIGPATPFLLFNSAVIFSAWFGGLGPGLLATGLAAFVANYYFLFPYGSVQITELSTITRLAVFTLEGSLISVSIAALQVFRLRAESSMRDAEGRRLSTHQQSEERFRLIVEGIRDYAIFMLDRDGIIISWNGGAERIKGYRADEILGRHFSCFYTEEDRAAGKPQRALALAANEGRFGEQGRRVRKDGQVFLADVVITALRSDEGQLRGYAKVTRDITGLRQADEALRREKEFSERLIHSSIDGILAFDRDCLYTVWNPGMEVISGVSEQEALGRCAFDVLPFLKREGADQYFLETLQGKVVFVGETPYSVPELGRDGFFEGCFSPLHGESGQIIGGLAIIRDVTDRRQAEEERARLIQEQAARAEAEASEERYRSLAEAIPQIVWTAKPDGYIDYFNQRWFEFTGLTSDESDHAVGWKAALHPDDQGAYESRWNASVRTGEVFEIEYRFRRASDETYRWHLGRALPVRGHAARIVKWFGTATDIHDRKRVEEQMRFLAEASTLLSSSLDYEATLASVARLSVPLVADWCLIDMARPDGSLERLSVVHNNLAKVELAQEIDRRYPPSPGDPYLRTHVFRTGRPEWIADISDEMRESVARDAEHLRLIRELEMNSYICVPLQARGRTLGALTFAAAESGRRFDSSDVALAEDLARRVALAVDNARLYREAKEALQSKDEAMALLDTLLSRAPVGFAFLDCDLRYVRINDALAAINGLSAAEHIGRTPRDLLSPELYAQVAPIYERVLKGGQPMLDCEVSGETRALPGVRRDWLTNYYPVRAHDGELLGLGIVVIEISDRKRTEKELQVAKETAEAASRAKDEFLAVLSHELRTPLTPILASVSAMLDDPATPAEVRPVIAMVRRNVELEARLIDDLLDVTRISRGKLQLFVEVVDAHSVIHQALDICRGEIYSARLRLSIALAAAEHHVKADPARLQQVFWNLIKNAVKFTPEGGAVSIRSRNELPENGEAGSARLVIEISDSGIGIEPELLPKVFNAFEQGEAAITRRFGGLGLGLPISRSVIEAHGGRLSATSEGKNQGATFIVALATVPSHVADSRAPEPAAPGTTPPRSLKILLVEDHEDTARTMAKLLRHHKFTVKTANSVVSALEMATAEDFDLVISDIGLPDGSGLDLMRRLRSRRAVKGIALSGFGMDDDIRKSQEAGFLAHLTKPIDYPKLAAMIQKVTSNIERTTVAP